MGPAGPSIPAITSLPGCVIAPANSRPIVSPPAIEQLDAQNAEQPSRPAAAEAVLFDALSQLALNLTHVKALMAGRFRCFSRRRGFE